MATLLRCFILLMAGVASCHAVLPTFSWSKVPVYWHAANFSGPLNDAVVEFVVTSGFASATIEKAQGVFGADNTTTFAEDRILAAARQLKFSKFNSSLFPVIAYFNSVLNWPYYRLARDVVADPSKALLNTSGLPVLLPGDPAFPQPAAGMEVFDFGQPSVVQWFADACQTLVDTGAIDGCFQDRAGENSYGKAVSANATARYAAGHDAVLRRMQSTIGPTNIVISNNYNLPGVRATMLERFDATEGSIRSLQTLAAAGYIVYAHAGNAANGADNHCADVTNSLAAFLIGAGENSLYACSKDWVIDPLWPAPNHPSDWMTWHPQYSRPLGPPHGLATRSSNGLWTRTFGNGTKVTFDAKTGEGVIAWSS